MKEYIRNFDEAKLKEAVAIKKAYSNGEISMELANAQMKAHIGSIKPSELAYIEQYMQQMIDDECIKENLDEIMGIYKDVLIEETSDLDPGHPIQNYIDENNQIRALVAKMEAQFQKNYIKNVWDELVENLNQFKVHLSRKQNQLYSLLEQKGFDRPTTTMWLFDNAVRDQISALSEKLTKEFQYEDIKEEFEEFKLYILDLMDKEDSILYPTSLEMINEAEFYEMISGDKEIGYCLITPSDEFANKHLESVKQNQTATAASQTAPASNASAAQNQGFADELSALLSKYNVGGWTEDTPMNVKQGVLSLNRINLLFQHLPVDISYVDEKELVAFYSDTKHRVFPRSKGVIGRDVKNCHPKNSVHVVEEIIEKFRSGEQDRVEFWINKPNLFIYILYVAVREEDGTFRGVMEMMQDCTKIRALEGSRTLLNWENDSSSAAKEVKSEEKSEVQGEAQAQAQESEQKAENESSEERLTKLEPKTKISKLFKDYPGFKDYMVQKSDKFKMLNSPMFKVMEPIATIEMASERSGMSIEELQALLDEYKKILA